MARNQKAIQARVVTPNQPAANTIYQEIALYGPDGKPLVLTDIPSPNVMKSLKSRITKLENRVKELEGES